MSACEKNAANQAAVNVNTPENETCPVTAYHRVNVCVPVTVTPYATVGKITTACCGTPLLSAGENECAGEADGSCTFTINQTLCLSVPVVFGADAAVGDTAVSCLGVSSENACANCHKESTGFRL